MADLQKQPKGVKLDHISKIYKDPKTGGEKTYKYKESHPVALSGQ